MKKITLSDAEKKALEEMKASFNAMSDIGKIKLMEHLDMLGQDCINDMSPQELIGLRAEILETEDAEILAHFEAQVKTRFEV